MSACGNRPLNWPILSRVRLPAVDGFGNSACSLTRACARTALEIRATVSRLLSLSLGRLLCGLLCAFLCAFAGALQGGGITDTRARAFPWIPAWIPGFRGNQLGNLTLRVIRRTPR